MPITNLLITIDIKLNSIQIKLIIDINFVNNNSPFIGTRNRLIHFSEISSHENFFDLELHQVTKQD